MVSNRGTPPNTKVPENPEEEMGPPPDPDSLSYPEFLALIQPFLSRMERTDKVETALEGLKDALPKWTPAGDAKIRLDALQIIEEYAHGRVGRSGSLPHEEFKRASAVQASLQVLRAWLEGDMEWARELETVSEEVGVQLDPSARGGGKILAGRAGPPKSLLAEYVVHLLHRRFSKWDGVSEFKEGNTQKLREWLHDELSDPDALSENYSWASRGLRWGDALAARPFSPEEIDPKYRGPLWSIIDNLRQP